MYDFTILLCYCCFIMRFLLSLNNKSQHVTVNIYYKGNCYYYCCECEVHLYFLINFGSHFFSKYGCHFYNFCYFECLYYLKVKIIKAVNSDKFSFTSEIFPLSKS